MSKLSMFIQSVLAVSIFYLGYTIYNFTDSVNRLIDVYPKALQSLGQTADHLNLDGWLSVADKYAEQTPAILKTVDGVSANIEQVSSTVSSLETQLPSVLEEVKAIRTGFGPDVLAESAALRKELPGLLAKMDGIVTQSEEISKNATQGAVKGVILSPINLIKDAGHGLKEKATGSSDEDE